MSAHHFQTGFIHIILTFKIGFNSIIIKPNRLNSSTIFVAYGKTIFPRTTPSLAPVALGTLDV